MSKWIPAWRYVPIDYNQDVAIFENITQKCLFTNNLSGTALRLRLSNPYGGTPFTVTHTAVTLRNRVTGVSSPAYSITLNGREAITVPARSEIYTDILSCPISWEDEILVAMYFKAQKSGESIIAQSIFRHAVEDLHHRHRLRLAGLSPHRQFPRNRRSGPYHQVPDHSGTVKRTPSPAVCGRHQRGSRPQ